MIPQTAFYRRLMMQPLSSIPSGSPPVSPKEAHPPLTKHKDRPDGPTISPESEPLSISQTGQEINRYTEAMALLPDIRKERITQIQAALENGTYAVSSQNLADKLIQELSDQLPDTSP
jgi:negative regulator of flagellin synthesis FlgM